MQLITSGLFFHVLNVRFFKIASMQILSSRNHRFQIPGARTGLFLVSGRVIFVWFLIGVLPLSAQSEELFDVISVEQGSPRSIGEARDLTSGDLIYREFHYSSGTSNQDYVIYRGVDNGLIAKKLLTFSSEKTRPELQLINDLSGEAIRIQADSKKSSYVVQYREDFDSRQEEGAIAGNASLVIDAGFDALIQQNWEHLGDNKPVYFDYLAPSRLRTFDFSLEKIMCGRPGPAFRCFQIAPKSWWLQRFLSPITLTYDISTKRLKTYAGLGNISDLSGKYMKVEIHYVYPGGKAAG